MNALLIDDRSLYRTLIVEVLRFEGINVHVASDAEAVRTAIQNTHFDLAFCALYMDGIDTLSLMAQLREQFPLLRIVALNRSSISEDFHMKSLTHTPFYLARPFTIESVHQLVRDVVGLRNPASAL